jgi:hypothetical protein
MDVDENYDDDGDDEPIKGSAKKESPRVDREAVETKQE